MAVKDTLRKELIKFISKDDTGDFADAVYLSKYIFMEMCKAVVFIMTEKGNIERSFSTAMALRAMYDLIYSPSDEDEDILCAPSDEDDEDEDEIELKVEHLDPKEIIKLLDRVFTRVNDEEDKKTEQEEK